MFECLKAGNILISDLEFTCSGKQIYRFDIFIVIDVFQNSVMLLHPKHEAEPDFDTGEYKRGLVLHPEYGLIRVFIDDERGYVL